VYGLQWEVSLQSIILQPCHNVAATTALPTVILLYIPSHVHPRDHEYILVIHKYVIYSHLAFNFASSPDKTLIKISFTFADERTLPPRVCAMAVRRTEEVAAVTEFHLTEGCPYP
jgi:hypothetical protein